MMLVTTGLSENILRVLSNITNEEDFVEVNNNYRNIIDKMIDMETIS